MIYMELLHNIWFATLEFTLTTIVSYVRNNNRDQFLTSKSRQLSFPPPENSQYTGNLCSDTITQQPNNNVT